MKKIIILLLILILPNILFAQTNELTFNYISDVRNLVYQKSTEWMRVIKVVALNLFYILAGISFIAKFIMDVMNKGEIDTRESISFIVKFIITTGFFYYLLDNGPELAKSIVTSFTELGTNAARMKPNFSDFMTTGFAVLDSGDAIGWSDWEIKIVHFVLSVLTIVFLIIMYSNLIIEEIAAAIMIYAGFFVLALGGMDYTRDSAINYFKAILGISLKILTIILLLTITVNIINDLQRDLNLVSDKKQADAMLIYKTLLSFLTVFFLALLSMKVPDAVSNLVSSAWGNMSGLTLMGGVALASSIAQKTANAVNSSFNSGKNAIAGFRDYNKNKEIDGMKKAAQERGEDTTLNPLFHKQKTGGGSSYYAGKATAAVSDKLRSIFGGSKEISNTGEKENSSSNNTNITNNINNIQPTDSNKSDNNTLKQPTQSEQPTQQDKETEVEKNTDKIDNSRESHLDGGRNV